MQVVCEATQNPSIDVQVGAFSCLVRIMSLYYEKMEFYMERALFGVSPGRLEPFQQHKTDP
jgi:importin subunit beta-1